MHHLLCVDLVIFRIFVDGLKSVVGVLGGDRIGGHHQLGKGRGGVSHIVLGPLLALHGG